MTEDNFSEPSKKSFLRKYKWYLLGAGILLISLILILLLRGNKNEWVQDSSGKWMKRGNPSGPPPDGITDFASCAKVYPVMTTFPEQCKTPDGRTFSNDNASPTGQQVNTTPTPFKSSAPVSSTSNQSPAQNNNSQPASDPQYASLPTLTNLYKNKTDQFLMDWDVISGGHPYKGKRANQPHSGAHIQLQNQEEWPKGGNAPENYPPIYAVADGVVSRLTNSLRVGENDRYGINLTVAYENNTPWEFEYSIEPMVPEPSPGFYLAFMKVKDGEKVKKGQIIGYFYLPVNANGTHIHFELMTAGSGTRMVPPAIFTPEVVHNFYLHWGNWGNDGDTPMAEGMGWMLNADENPFTGTAADTI